MGKPSLLATAVVLSLLLSCQPLRTVTSDHFHVRVVPDLSGECDQTEERCYTFSESLQKAGEVFRSNTSIQFSSGDYSIPYRNVGGNVTIARATNLALIGPDSSYGRAFIKCHSRFRFDFLDGENVTLVNLFFSDCGSWSEHSSGVLIFNRVSSLTVASVIVQDSYGYGLMGMHLSGNINIFNCTFLNNSAREGNNGSTRMGGNCLLHITDAELPTSLTVSDSWFANGTAEELNIRKLLDIYVPPSVGGGGLAVYFVTEQSYHTLGDHIITIQNSTFLNNSAPYGGNALLYVYARAFLQVYPRAFVHVYNSTFKGGTAYLKGGGLYLQGQGNSGMITMELSWSRFIGNKAWRGGGLCLALRSSPLMQISNPNMILTFSKLLVFENRAEKGGGIFAESLLWFGKVYISIVYSRISHNFARNGGGVFLFFLSYKDRFLNRKFLKTEDLIYVKQHEVSSVHSTRFIGNKAEIGSALTLQTPTISRELKMERCPLPAIASIWLKDVWIGRNIGDGSVNANTLQWIILENTTFHRNLGTGIYANSSSIVLTGKVKFHGNYGCYGGAVWLSCHCDPNFSISYLYLVNSSHTTITNNQALKYGGGIITSEKCDNQNTCFFQRMYPDKWNMTLTASHRATVEMRDNHALLSGDDVYGASKLHCSLFRRFDTGELLHPKKEESFFNFYFTIANKTMSSVSSIPYRVCFCTQNSPKEHCLNYTRKSIFPGQDFTISAATVGNHRGVSPAVVLSQFCSSQGIEGVAQCHLNNVEVQAQFGTRQEVQKLGRTCGTLAYSIRTSASSIQLYLTVADFQEIGSKLLPAVVSLTVLSCPLGFQMINDPPECGCMPYLLSAGVVCDINTQTHQCPTGMWIGNFSGSVVTHPHCPLGYCRPGKPIVNLTAQYKQCLYNRYGVLCGACQPGLSLNLGSSQCSKCSNIYLLLLVSFIVAGVALVFLLLKCNFTVSLGTINGLNFYANVIRFNHTIFFPRDGIGSLVSFLSTFIAWLNLDLGIQVCFFNGLDAFTRAWLQFLFPAYIWILVVVMITGSRYSTSVAKIVGNNAVPVLATLFLLSYAKLLRAVIDSMSFTTIADPE